MIATKEQYELWLRMCDGEVITVEDWERGGPLMSQFYRWNARRWPRSSIASGKFGIGTMLAMGLTKQEAHAKLRDHMEQALSREMEPPKCTP